VGTSNSGPMRQRVEMEHALKAAYALQNEGRVWHGVELARSLGLPDALAENIAKALIASGWAEESKPGNMRLTETGEARAVELIRAHRLWERYLVDREGMSLDAVHTEAHHREHETTPEELEKLDTALGYPAWDPHGHAIPASGSRMPSPAGQSLLGVGIPGSRLRIVRLDDEPVELLTQLVALGLEPGVDMEILTLESDLLRLRLDGNVIPLSYAAAGHVFVVPTPAQPVPMGKLAVGSRAQVVELTGSGKLQRRMLAMGFVPGAEVTVIREAPLGDPRQYRVKKANIALRHNEANTLLVEELDGKREHGLAGFNGWGST
jgi:Fe2+ transport system protein FeoA/Mn-dependent DtxR family transcriptional regulator